ncbi:21 kDa subunit of NADH dehydrogenase [Sistotremastrum suecicum HHB10207 ss-3]|uniref:21 kDa subunit of NADH dehydrogenase n=1 Tax=Sistotremastrum suecicum HHB10207 ss-3 TaxID=1314776 RepID=A0A166GB82_9AGAM|nr:21 kDa subunit of NADH dehydrogenase [Sistotremastrum suecicum HHB10207 ss-3]
MSVKKAADHTLYHLSPKGFWKKFRDVAAANPEISSGLPLQSLNRQPPPGSRPEKYSTPATKASDPAQNPYWKRDVRRAYPQLSVVTQSELAKFLLQSPEKQQSIEKPAEAGKDASVPTTSTSTTPDLIAAINEITSVSKVFSESNLPPTPTISFKKWTPEDAPPAPHDPNAYFPMNLIK